MLDINSQKYKQIFHVEGERTNIFLKKAEKLHENIPSATKFEILLSYKNKVLIKKVIKS